MKRNIELTHMKKRCM